ncbi:MAG: LLM class flavin-dependent oxidoreductase [Ilumatobacteraceae bacterium]
MAQQPFRFGVHIGPAEAPGDIVAMARRAEELGYEMFVADDSPRHGWGVWSVLAAAAMATRRAELVAMTTGGRADRDARRQGTGHAAAAERGPGPARMRRPRHLLRLRWTRRVARSRAHPSIGSTA